MKEIYEMCRGRSPQHYVEICVAQQCFPVRLLPNAEHFGAEFEEKIYIAGYRHMLPNQEMRLIAGDTNDVMLLVDNEQNVLLSVRCLSEDYWQWLNRYEIWT